MEIAEVKPLTFRVYPENRSLYFKVNIWPTKKAMHKHCSWVTGKFEAVVSGRDTYQFRKGKSTRLLPNMGEINFYRGYIGASVVCHEMLHAGMRWLERIKIASSLLDHRGVDCSPAEERLCHAVGLMVDQFTYQCLRRGLSDTLVKEKSK